MENWIGKIEMSDGVSATLTRQGWISDDKILAAKLNLDYSVGSVSDMGLPAGWGAVACAASSLKAQAIYPRKLPPLKEGEVS